MILPRPLLKAVGPPMGTELKEEDERYPGCMEAWLTPVWLNGLVSAAKKPSGRGFILRIRERRPSGGLRSAAASDESSASDDYV